MAIWNGSRLRTALLLGTAFAITLLVARVPTDAQSQVREESVTFSAGAVTLSGTLLRPPGLGVHPAIVLLHGSGPGPRQELRFFAERFTRLGLAALIFDKRGSGSSGGSWTEESLDDLADDALAATTFLKTLQGIDPGQVGVWGISQAGWVVPRAAARVPSAFAFAIIITGGGIKPLVLEENDYGAALDRAGIEGVGRREALAIVEQYFAYLRTGKDRARLEAAIQEARDKPWFQSVDISRVLPSESVRSKWEWVATYDPAPDIQRMTMPILIVLGGKDRSELFGDMNEGWKRSLAKANNSDSTIIELLGADHGGAVAGTHHIIYSGGPHTYVPGYLELVDGWLEGHVKPIDQSEQQ